MRFLVFLLCALPVAAQKGHELCNACHQEQTADFLTHKHARSGLSCDACHGPSVKHRTSTGAAPPDRVAAPDEVPKLCGACHAQAHREYLTSRHAKLVLERSKTRSAHCGTCHGVHAARTARQTEVQCGRCHSGPPSRCKREAGATSGCLACHAGHTLRRK
ncbi:MAG: cytochrome c3 family protein [Acidobacteria bacterium]|nr:cytochrome c3 family protein [Acidobacteriota bacterium]